MIFGPRRNVARVLADDLEGAGCAQNDIVTVGFKKMPTPLSHGKFQCSTAAFRLNVLNATAHCAGFSGFERRKYLIQPILAGGRM